MYAISRRAFTGVLILAAFALGISALVRYLAMDSVATNAVIIEQGLEMYDFHYKPWNVVLLLHIVTAAIPLMIGPFQFMKKIRNKRANLHRTLGKIYIVSIMVSGILGLYLSWYAFGGWSTKLGFFCLSVAWLWTTYVAYKRIRNKQVAQHERWMYRSYAVTFVAITFRIWTGVIGYSTDNFALGYSAAIWIGLLGNMAVMEYWLRKKAANIHTKKG